MYHPVFTHCSRVVVSASNSVVSKNFGMNAVLWHMLIMFCGQWCWSDKVGGECQGVSWCGVTTSLWAGKGSMGLVWCIFCWWTWVICLRAVGIVDVSTVLWWLTTILMWFGKSFIVSWNMSAGQCSASWYHFCFIGVHMQMCCGRAAINWLAASAATKAGDSSGITQFCEKRQVIGDASFPHARHENVYAPIVLWWSLWMTSVTPSWSPWGKLLWCLIHYGLCAW